MTLPILYKAYSVQRPPYYSLHNFTFFLRTQQPLRTLNLIKVIRFKSLLEIPLRATRSCMIGNVRNYYHSLRASAKHQ